MIPHEVVKLFTPLCVYFLLLIAAVYSERDEGDELDTRATPPHSLSDAIPILTRYYDEVRKQHIRSKKVTVKAIPPVKGGSFGEQSVFAVNSNPLHISGLQLHYFIPANCTLAYLTFSIQGPRSTRQLTDTICGWRSIDITSFVHELGDSVTSFIVQTDQACSNPTNLSAATSSSDSQKSDYKHKTASSSTSTHESHPPFLLLFHGWKLTDADSAGRRRRSLASHNEILFGSGKVAKRRDQKGYTVYDGTLGGGLKEINIAPPAPAPKSVVRNYWMVTKSPLPSDYLQKGNRRNRRKNRRNRMSGSLTTLRDTSYIPYPKNYRGVYVDDEKRKRREKRLERKRRRRKMMEKMMRNSTICQRKPMMVNFDQLGWRPWVVAPRAYQAHTCAGSCSYPVDQMSQPTNHALLQALIEQVNLSRASKNKRHKRLKTTLSPSPHSSCVPIKYDSQTLLFYNAKNELVLRNYPNMVVKQCGCR